jgi:hypothetical protein
MNPNDRIPMRLVGTIVSVLALSGLALGTVALVGVDPNALCLLPALVLAAPLLMRRYPGARVLAGMSDRRRSRWPLPRATAPRLGRIFSIAPHGGELIARSLAVRPPPPLFPAS